MNKKLKATMLVAAVAAAGFTTWMAYDYSETNKSTIIASSIDAHANIFDDLAEYWNRNDYDCVDVDCVIYESTMAKFVGEGKGSQPHSWSCPGCNL